MTKTEKQNIFLTLGRILYDAVSVIYMTQKEYRYCDLSF